jgi:hypothetical protein
LNYYRRPWAHDKYEANPQVRMPTKKSIKGAFFLSVFSIPLTKVVFASLIGGDSGGT